MTLRSSRQKPPVPSFGIIRQGNVADQRREHSGEKTFSPAIPPGRAHAPNDMKAFAPFGEKARYLTGMVLQVAGYNDSGIAGCEAQAGCCADVASIIAAQPNYFNTRIGAIEIGPEAQTCYLCCRLR